MSGSNRGALFIGCVSRDARQRDLEQLFEKFGTITRCDLRNGFAFVTYEDERDAEDALRERNGMDFFGQRYYYMRHT